MTAGGHPPGRAVERLGGPRARARGQPGGVDHHLDLVGLAHVAHVRAVAERGALHLDGVLANPRGELRLQRPLLARERGQVEGVEPAVHRPHRGVQDVGGDGPEGAERAGRPRDEHGRNPHVAGQQAPHQRARAAEGHQREVARVDPGAREDLAEGGIHVRHRDAHDALRRLVRAHAEPVREAADRLLGERAVEPHPPAEEAVGIEEAAH